MSQCEQAERMSPVSVMATRPVPIDREDDVDSLREKIRSGRAYLKVSAYPWGVEFDVLEVEGSR